MIRLENVHAGYGRVTVLRGISIDVAPGDCRVVIGPNGAGKTTMLRTIFGLLKPTQGRVFVGDEDVTGLQPRALLDRGIAYVPQQSSIFPRLTVRDNLEMGLFQSGRSDPRLIDGVFERFDLLARRRDTHAQALSGGERRLLEIARALMIRPRLLMLDEPSLGLSPVMMERVLREVAEINGQGVTVLLVEQRVKAALTVANTISVLRLGAISQQGTKNDAADPKWLADAIYGSNEPVQASA
jgi:branched-chain amino acid transport system ATP-binding protein